MQGPVSTYRLQLNKDFTFNQARELADYWQALGVGSCYLSPIFEAHKGSMHGYDVINPGAFNPEIGTEAEFAQFSQALRARGMELIIDVVPNHMSIADGANPWWNDVLANGPASHYARYFDILWQPPKTSLTNKVLLPILGDQYGRMIENGEIKLVSEPGHSFAQVYGTRLPLSQASLAKIGPGPIEELNGTKGDPRSFDRLEALMNDQWYRLCYWRVASDEINYRRFFDVSDLAAIRVEEPEVFEAVHKLVFRLIKEGQVQGLRIDHVDGLYDPKKYLSDLQREKSHFYVVVEKILTGDERLRADWDVDGTTGYDYTNLVNGMFVDEKNRRRFHDLYARFTGVSQSFREIQNASKRLILLSTLASELRVLAIQLEKISEQHRWSRDFTFEVLRFSLREVIAAFPVYRTYVQPDSDDMSQDDRRAIRDAVRQAKRNNPIVDPSVFDFIGSVLLLEHPEGLSDENKLTRRRFVLKLQQLTSSVMAKGTEDTAFYRYLPLASLDEVGGSPEKFGTTIKEFHQANAERARRWPRSLVTTTTHDTKRSEDVRARINVLSEMPLPWYRAVRKWRLLNRSRKSTVDDMPAPDANDEYLLYQTLIGCWPLEGMEPKVHASFVDRIAAYMQKAAKEAKQYTSWVHPNDDYEVALDRFVRAVLEPKDDNPFLRDFAVFEKSVRPFGLMNALCQVALKITSPGVPDFYQGTETWNFCLVDPDNRRPVDYEEIKHMLASFKVDQPTNIHDPRAKLWVTQACLTLRNRQRELFEQGEYMPLAVTGSAKKDVVAFARRLNDQCVITIAGRFFTRFNAENTRVRGFPAGTYRDVLTGNSYSNASVAQLLAHFPVAVLERVSA